MSSTFTALLSIACVLCTFHLLTTSTSDSDPNTGGCPASTNINDNDPNIHRYTASETAHSARNIRKVILDCDPGVDDLYAMLWLMSQASKGLIEVMAVTTVQGNTATPFDSFRNVVHMLNITTNRDDILVGKMNVDPDAADAYAPPDDFFADDGIGNLSRTLFGELDDELVVSPESQILDAFNDARVTQFSEEIMVRLLLAHPYELTVICVGPLTNLVRAERLHPGILGYAREILIMGGSFLDKIGNAHILSEFNFVADAPSTLEFFSVIVNQYKKPPPVVVFPLDITATLQWTSDDLDLLFSLLSSEAQSDIDLCRMRLEGLDFFEEQREEDDEEEQEFLDSLRCFANGMVYVLLERTTEMMNAQHFEFGHGDYMQLHDPAIIGYLLYPHLYDFKHVYIHILPSNAMSYFDQRLLPLNQESIRVPNVWVALDVDAASIPKAFTRDVMQLINSMSAGGA